MDDVLNHFHSTRALDELHICIFERKELNKLAIHMQMIKSPFIDEHTLNPSRRLRKRGLES